VLYVTVPQDMMGGWLQVSCSVLQCVAVCCSIFRDCASGYDWRLATDYFTVFISVCCVIVPQDMLGGVLQCVAVCCSVLQCVAVCCSVSGYNERLAAVCCTVLQRVALCFSASEYDGRLTACVYVSVCLCAYVPVCLCVCVSVCLCLRRWVCCYHELCPCLCPCLYL